MLSMVNILRGQHQFSTLRITEINKYNLTPRASRMNRDPITNTSNSKVPMGYWSVPRPRLTLEDPSPIDQDPGRLGFRSPVQRSSADIAISGPSIALLYLLQCTLSRYDPIGETRYSICANHGH